MPGTQETGITVLSSGAQAGGYTGSMHRGQVLGGDELGPAAWEPGIQRSARARRAVFRAKCLEPWVSLLICEKGGSGDRAPLADTVHRENGGASPGPALGGDPGSGHLPSANNLGTSEAL